MGDNAFLFYMTAENDGERMASFSRANARVHSSGMSSAQPAMPPSARLQSSADGHCNWRFASGLSPAGSFSTPREWVPPSTHCHFLFETRPDRHEIVSVSLDTYAIDSFDCNATRIELVEIERSGRERHRQTICGPSRKFAVTRQQYSTSAAGSALLIVFSTRDGSLSAHTRSADWLSGTFRYHNGRPPEQIPKEPRPRCEVIWPTYYFLPPTEFFSGHKLRESECGYVFHANRSARAWQFAHPPLFAALANASSLGASDDAAPSIVLDDSSDDEASSADSRSLDCTYLFVPSSTESDRAAVTITVERADLTALKESTASAATEWTSSSPRPRCRTVAVASGYRCTFDDAFDSPWIVERKTKPETVSRARWHKLRMNAISYISVVAAVHRSPGK